MPLHVDIQSLQSHLGMRIKKASVITDMYMMPNPLLSGKLVIGSYTNEFSTTKQWHDSISSWPTRIRPKDSILFTKYTNKVKVQIYKTLPTFRALLNSGPSLFALLAAAVDFLMGGTASAFVETSYQLIIRPIPKKTRGRPNGKTEYEILWVVIDALPRQEDLFFEVLKVPGFQVECGSRGWFDLQRGNFVESAPIKNEIDPDDILRHHTVVCVEIEKPNTQSKKNKTAKDKLITAPAAASHAEAEIVKTIDKATPGDVTLVKLELEKYSAVISIDAEPVMNETVIEIADSRPEEPEVTVDESTRIIQEPNNAPDRYSVEGTYSSRSFSRSRLPSIAIRTSFR